MKPSIPYAHQSFKAAWWLRNAHLQTVWAALCRPKNVVTTEERIELPDGDFLDIHWVGKQKNSPILLILHGLAGSLASPYVQRLLPLIEKRGWRGVLMNFRGCSGIPNRLARSYHSGDTADLNMVVQQLLQREPHTPIFAIGYSLGGNVLLKWLGEDGQQGIANSIEAAVAVSIPFELKKTVEKLNKGFSRIYQKRLLRELLASHQRKFNTLSSPIDFGDIHKIQNFYDFDNRITAPLHGFKNADDYYLRSSCRPFLSSIKIPTLILQAKDDPFVSEDAIPTLRELSPSVHLVLSEQGGHVGFVDGKIPWKPNYWLNDRILSFVQQRLLL